MVQGDDRLTAIPERMMMANRPVVLDHNFNAPQYKEKADMEYFIIQFEEIVAANEWRITFLRVGWIPEGIHKNLSHTPFDKETLKKISKNIHVRKSIA